MSEAEEGQRFKDLWAWADEDSVELVPEPVSYTHLTLPTILLV